MAISLPNFPPFDVHLEGNAGPRWQKWLARCERLAIAMGITEDKQKRALLLHYGGPEIDEIFDTLQDVWRGQGLQESRRKTNRPLLSTSQRNIRSI